MRPKPKDMDVSVRMPRRECRQLAGSTGPIEVPPEEVKPTVTAYPVSSRPEPKPRGVPPALMVRPS